MGTHAGSGAASGRYREVMHRAVNAYRLVIVDDKSGVCGSTTCHACRTKAARLSCASDLSIFSRLSSSFGIFALPLERFVTGNTGAEKLSVTASKPNNR
jgi:hypothetical protein